MRRGSYEKIILACYLPESVNELVNELYSQYLELILISIFGCRNKHDSVSICMPSKNFFDLLDILAGILLKSNIYSNAGILEFT